MVPPRDKVLKLVVQACEQVITLRIVLLLYVLCQLINGFEHRCVEAYTVLVFHAAGVFQSGHNSVLGVFWHQFAGGAESRLCCTVWRFAAGLARRGKGRG